MGRPGKCACKRPANGALSDQIAFGSSYPFRAMRQSIEDYQRIGFRDDVLDKLFYRNAARLLKLE